MPPAQATKTALVVDDEQSIRLGFSVALRSVGFEVLTAEDGGVALDLAFIHQPLCIILDLRMPGADGIAVAHCLRESGYLKPIILASAFADHKAAIDAMRAGIVDFLTKPVKPSEIRYAANHAMDRHQRFSSIAAETLDQIPAAQHRAFGKYCISQCNRPLAREALQSALQSGPDLQSLLLLGAVYEIENDASRAADTFLRAAELRRHSVEGMASVSLFKVFSHSDTHISD